MDTKIRIKRKVSDILALSIDDIGDDFLIEEELGADSLDAVELIMALEEEFNMEIPDDNAKALKTVKDIERYVDQHIGD